MVITGKAKPVALLQTQLIEQLPQLRVRNMRINFRRQKPDSLGFVNATFTVEAYYQRGEQS